MHPPIRVNRATMTPHETLILASASPRRHELLAPLGVAFEVQPCPLPEPERKPPAVSPESWALALAYFKARSVAELQPRRWVLGADTIVVCGGEILGKPRDLADARRMLTVQAGRETDVVTGVCFVRLTDREQRLGAVDVTRVWMRDDATVREAYLASGDWAGKAGAYGIQTVGDRLVERVSGSFSNVVGLPVERLRAMLTRLEPPLVASTPPVPPANVRGAVDG